MSDLIDRFIELFQGNAAAIGTEEGGCVHHNTDNPELEWRLGVHGHLTGHNPPIGVYPVVYTPELRKMAGTMPAAWEVHWGCVDFDEGEEDSWVHASNVYKALAAFDITGWIERSRSKGYHVWVFARDWVPATTMRFALLGACQLVDAPMREINPKQTTLEPDQLGNYVRLPYPGWLSPTLILQARQAAENTLKRVMVTTDCQSYWPLRNFVEAAWGKRTDVDRLEALSAHYTWREVPFKPRRDWDPTPLEGDMVSRLLGKARVIFQQGPLEGSDRSDTLWKLARYLREDARHSYEEAMILLRDADSRWGKFHARPDGEVRLKELLDKAWT
jgi:hypothetical protein